MITFKAKSTNNIPSIMAKYDFDKDSFLKDVQTIGLKSVKANTPVITGKLRDNNAALIARDNVYFYNNMSYFKFVNFGTIYQASNPFIQRGLAATEALLVSSLIGNLRV